MRPDTIILSVPAYRSENDGKPKELKITLTHPWCGKTIAELELPEHLLIALIKRGDENLIPQGSTHIYTGDRVVIYR